MKVSIVGATGYGGAELIRIINNHSSLSLESVHSSSKTGQAISTEYPHFMHKIEKILMEINPEQMAKTSDLVFLATPNGISKGLTPFFKDLNIKVIDLSGDLRLKDREQYQKWYKKEAASEEVTGSAVYGLSEWNQENISQADIIANPGCFPTASLLGLAPIIKNFTSIEDIIIDAKTGVSGAGRSLSSASHFSEVNENLKIYKVHEHQHTPEIEQQIKAWNKNSPNISFSAHLIPMTRGIMATMYVKADRVTSSREIWDLYKEAYEGKPFVRLHPPGSFPCTKHVYGSNFCDIGVAYDERTNRITIVSVIDNLMKGAAGQAVQNANLMFGFNESDGLLNLPLFP
ncbi:N-acetyl-gamma-glutamyl-phosphate reductase [Peribacillus deserti]|uniref:N-acetyl-gamma-glutamyl-phosphate reductase n=1 Tax=Peribacillus deserti TaxID=673318 RepID=A0ABS2QLC8_9BACI|nr:N-acetyl-gamma-glutamyl-phosphate reductase [Peribacillus deserti]MBM7693977.1 N-acetyl-gamma-glutamyl-phosphate reductase [Peribacillus deserti]